MSKQKFLNLLKDLSDDADGFRKSAFLKAINSIKTVPNDVLTIEIVSKLPNVGKGILNRFREFLESGTLKEVKESKIKSTSDDGVLELFQGIYGVGPVQSEKWYDKGIKTLQDLVLYNERNDGSLTYAQKLGLKYYEDINERIPRIEIKLIEFKLALLVRSYNTLRNLKVEIKICGSYLRGKESSGDIDIIIREKDDKLDIGDFLEHIRSIVKYILGKGDVKVLCLGGVNKMRRIDFELVKNRSWAYAMLYFTGSKEHNRIMRQKAKNAGFLLNHSGLYAKGSDNSNSLEVDSEEDIFLALDMEYKTPQERDL